MLVIQNDPERAARSEHPARLGEAASDVGRMMQHAIRVHDVEACVGEREVLGVPFVNLRRKSKMAEMLTYAFNVFGGNVDSRVVRPLAHELVGVVSSAAPELQDAL